MSTGTVGAISLRNPDCTEVPTGKLNSSENLAPKQAAPGAVSPGKFCTGAAQWEREFSGLGFFLSSKMHFCPEIEYFLQNMVVFARTSQVSTG